MKINFFVKLIFLLPFLTNSLGANEAVSSALGLINLDMFESAVVRKNDSSAPNLDRSIDRLKEIILTTENLKSLGFDQPYFVIAAENSLRIFTLNENLEIISQVETTDLNYINITAVGISAAKQVLACANKQNDILVFDISNNNFEMVDSYLGNGKPANSIAFCPDGSKFAVTSYESDVVSLFSINEGSVSKIMTLYTSLGSGPIIAKFSKDAEQIAILCQKHNVIKVFSHTENEWKLTDSLNIAKNQFMYDFDGNKLIVSDAVIPDIIVEDASVNNVPVSSVNDLSGDQGSLVKEESLVSPMVEKELEILTQAKELQSGSVNVFQNPAILDKPSLVLVSKSTTLTKTSRPEIRGKTAPGQKVEIYCNDQFLAEVISNQNGDFNFRSKNTLRNGSYCFSAKIHWVDSYISSNVINIVINRQYPLKKARRKKR